MGEKTIKLACASMLKMSKELLDQLAVEAVTGGGEISEDPHKWPDFPEIYTFAQLFPDEVAGPCSSGMESRKLGLLDYVRQCAVFQYEVLHPETRATATETDEPQSAPPSVGLMGRKPQTSSQSAQMCICGGSGDKIYKIEV